MQKALQPRDDIDKLFVSGKKEGVDSPASMHRYDESKTT